MTTFLKTTMLGGVLFLLPLAIVLMVLGYALGLAAKVAQPISEKLQLDDWGTVAGVGVVTVLSAPGAGLSCLRRRPCRSHLFG